MKFVTKLISIKFVSELVSKPISKLVSKISYQDFSHSLLLDQSHAPWVFQIVQLCIK